MQEHLHFPALAIRIRAVGSNSEAYSDNREQVVAEKLRTSGVSCLSCHDSGRGGMRTMPLRSSTQDGVGFAFYIALVCWASQARHQPIALVGWR